MLDRPAEATPAPPESRQNHRQPRTQANHADPAALSGAAILAILRRHRLALFAPMLLLPLLAWIALAQFTPRYTATGACSTTPASTRRANCKVSCASIRSPTP